MKTQKIAAIFILILFVLIWKIITIQNVLNKLERIKDGLESYEEQLLISNQKLHDESQNDTIIYAITPTYHRLVQKAELIRISQTLQLIPNIHWIVVEDSYKKSDLVKHLLNESQLRTTHLHAETAQQSILKRLVNYLKGWTGHRGVEQRNMGLRWLRKNLRLGLDKGVVYFMDDDNAYNVKIFKEMSRIQRVGVWPVGLVGGLNVESPVVKSGKVVGFVSGWRQDRMFAMDMAGFAINLELILTKHDVWFSQDTAPGMQETEFLCRFTTVAQLEPLADNCSKVYVWHTRTEEPKVHGTVLGFEV